MATIETRFDTGDTVYGVHWRQHTDRRPCTSCLGKRGLKHPETEAWFPCSHCGGHGTHVRNVGQGFFVEGPYTIGQLEFSYRGKYDAPPGTDETFDNYGSQAGLTQERYMCRETGLGTGRGYDADDLFHTIAEAVTAAQQRNKAYKAEEHKPQPGISHETELPTDEQVERAAYSHLAPKTEAPE